jgi:uncharacterized protein YbaR (Trm112 family)
VFVELIESLRCPPCQRRREETTLVASATKTEARHIVEGVLGCPVCNAEYEIHDGIADFGPPPMPAATIDAPSQETAMRLAAFLELTDAQGFAVLCGRWAMHLEPLSRLTETPIVVVNPPAGATVRVAGGAIRGNVIPFALGSSRAVAFDEAATPEILFHGLYALRPGGRVLAPASLPVPPGVGELVRDAEVWVGEKSTAPPTPVVFIAKRRA